jgi:hypothetical protein
MIVLWFIKLYCNKCTVYYVTFNSIVISIIIIQFTLNNTSFITAMNRIRYIRSTLNNTLIDEWEYLTSREYLCRPVVNYVNSSYSGYPGISENTRLKTVDWMRHLCCNCSIVDEAFFLMVNFFDRVMPLLPIPLFKINLVAICCALLAVKSIGSVEDKSMTVKDAYNHCDKVFSEKQIVLMEKHIWSLLDYRAHGIVTVDHYTRILFYSKQLFPASTDHDTKDTLQLLTLISCYIYGLERKFKPSIIACACTSIVLAGIPEGQSSRLICFTPRDLSQVLECATTITRFLLHWCHDIVPTRSSFLIRNHNIYSNSNQHVCLIGIQSICSKVKIPYYSFFTKLKHLATRWNV